MRAGKPAKCLANRRRSGAGNRRVQVRRVPPEGIEDDFNPAGFKSLQAPGGPVGLSRDRPSEPRQLADRVGIQAHGVATGRNSEKATPSFCPEQEVQFQNNYAYLVSDLIHFSPTFARKIAEIAQT